MKKALDLIFPQDLIREPIVCQMSRQFNVVFNIRRARVTSKIGEMILELEGEQKALDAAMVWLKSQGIKVEPVTHDALEG